MTTSTLTFDGTHSGSSFSENGFLFTVADKSTGAPGSLSGSNELDFDYRNNVLTITHGGTPFDLYSLDFDGMTPGGGGEGPGIYQTVLVTTTLANGNEGSFEAAFDNSAGFETFGPGSTGIGSIGLGSPHGGDTPALNVVSLTITAQSVFGVNGIRLDNLVYSLGDSNLIDFTHATVFNDNSVTSQGYTLSIPAANVEPGSPLFQDGVNSYWGDRGTGDDVMLNRSYVPVTLTPDAGGTFGVASVDLDVAYNYGPPSAGGEALFETVTGKFADGHTEDFVAALDGYDGFETFDLPASFGAGLVSLTFQPLGSNALLIDNIRLGSGNGLALNGTAGDDQIQGVQGTLGAAVAINGLAGTDTVDFSQATGGVSADLAAGTATGTGVNLTMTRVENLTGSSHDDTLTGNDRANVLNGGGGDDQLHGGGGTDTLVGGIGADLLDGGKGADVMAGGEGNDSYYVDDANDVVNESVGQGFDTVTVTGKWTATAGSEIEKIVLAGTGNYGATANEHVQEIDGNAGNNTLDDGGNAVTLVGGDGADKYYVGNAGTTIVEGATSGQDVVLTTLNTYTLPANIEKVLFTGSGDFDFTGTSGSESVFGGTGNDTLRTGGGADTLKGNGGNDTFILDAPGATIVDWDPATDTLRLPFAVGAQVITSMNHTPVGHAVVVLDAMHGHVFYEADGDPAHKVLVATLLGSHDITPGDIVLL